MSEKIFVTFGQLPAGFCPSTPQELVNKLNDIVSAYEEDQPIGVIVSQDPPGPEDYDKIWAEIDASNHPIGFWFFDGGDWLWPHPTSQWASSNVRMLWVGTEAQLVTFDGGEAGPITTTTGAFWVVDTDYGDKGLMGVITGGTYSVGVNQSVWQATSPGNPQIRGIFVIKRTIRTFLRHV